MAEKSKCLVSWRGVRIPLLLMLIMAWVAGLIPSSAFAQMYLPPAPYRYWDMWILKDNDVFHNFWLQSDEEYIWNTIGHAVSKDMIHWEPLPPIPSKGAPGSWDENPTLTGITVRVEKPFEYDGMVVRYAMFYGSESSYRAKNPNNQTETSQQIGVMFSDDLMRWKKYHKNPVLKITPPFYLDPGIEFRDIDVVYDKENDIYHAYVGSEAAVISPEIQPVKERTLVAWVYLSPKNQSGSGVLTVNYGRGNYAEPGGLYDGIVLGNSSAPGRWLNGSEAENRTRKDPAILAQDTAAPAELVQTAIVYQSDKVTVYRNGQPYDSYPLSDTDFILSSQTPIFMGSGSCVTMGLRSLDDKGDSSAYFAGVIEEARIYSSALDPDTIRSLTPNNPAGPAPLARWTFEDGTARDEMDTFQYKRELDSLQPQLHGGAYIADGKLHLDGVDDYFQTLTRKGEMCISHMTSKNLVDWEYHPPIFSSNSFPGILSPEDPDYFELNGRHYFFFSSWGARLNTSGRTNAAGTYYIMADRAEGPYRLPASPCLMGTSRLDNYCGRTVPFGDSYLVYSYTCGVPFTRPATIGVPRLLHQNEDGTLWLQYWPGLNKLETKTLVDGARLAEMDLGNRLGSGTWTVQGNQLQGASPENETSVLWLPFENLDSYMLTGMLDLSHAQTVAVLSRWNGKQAGSVLFDVPSDTVHVGFHQESGNTIEFKSHDAVKNLQLTSGPQHVRIMIRAWRAEVYINDHWVFGTSIDEMPEKGGIGLAVKSGSATFTDLRVAEIEPLVQASYKDVNTETTAGATSVHAKDKTILPQHSMEKEVLEATKDPDA